MWGAIVDAIAGVLSQLSAALGDNWGLAIILFTVIVKLATWPLTSKQIRSTKAMQELQPKIKALQEKYKDDKEAQTREMMKLYQEMGVNPAMGCLPMLIQIPIWIGLYQAIQNLANAGSLQNGFLFLPSLAFPNNSMDWVMDFSRYGETWPYFILPILTVVTQFAVSKIMSPPTPATNSKKNDDPTQAMMKQMTTIMPIMFGAFALQFPSGLALYWVTSNVLTGVQYFVLNRENLPGNPKPAAAASLAPVAAGEGKTVIEGTTKKSEYSKGQNDGKSRRKRKKR